MLLLLRFFTFFKFFFKIQKVVTFYVFCRVSYVFSNYDCIYGPIPNIVLNFNVD